MKHAVVLVGTFLVLCSGCNREQSDEGPGGLRLGDTESQVADKMKKLGASDVTDQTKYTLYQALSGEQKYSWWLLPDKTVVGVLLAGRTMDSLKVLTIEVGEPGKGVEGIAHWRSQNLKTITSTEHGRSP